MEQTTGKVSERLVWAVDTLAVSPRDDVLEVGCGHGVAVSLVCAKLDGGHITAIDRSSKMIALATKRNAACIAAGTASFVRVSLHAAEFGTARFDKIFGIRIGLFVRANPARELEVITRYLAPHGSFYLVYDPVVPTQVMAVIEKATAALEHHGFAIKAVLQKNIARATVACVIAGKRC